MEKRSRAMEKVAAAMAMGKHFPPSSETGILPKKLGPPGAGAVHVSDEVPAAGSHPEADAVGEGGRPEVSRGRDPTEDGPGLSVFRLPASRKELERLVDPTLGFDWGFVEEAMGVEVRKRAAAEVATAEVRDERRRLALQEERAKPLSLEEAISAEHMRRSTTTMDFLRRWNALDDEKQILWFERSSDLLEKLWKEAGVAIRDREMFRVAYLRERVILPGTALAVAQHLTVVTEHLAARDAVRAAIRERDDVLHALHDLLLQFADHRPQPSKANITEALRRAKKAVKGHVVSSEVGLDAGITALLARESEGGKPPDAGPRFDGPLAGLADVMRTDLSHGRLSFRGAFFDALEASLTAEEKEAMMRFRVRTRVLLLTVLKATTAVVEGIIRLRATMWRPQPYIFRGQNLIHRMAADIEFLLEEPFASLLQIMRVPQDEVLLLLAFAHPPPTTSEDAADAERARSASTFTPDAGGGDEMGIKTNEATRTGSSTPSRRRRRLPAKHRGRDGGGEESEEDEVDLKVAIPTKFRTPAIGSVLSLCPGEVVIPDLRMIKRLDTAVRTMHEERELQWRLRKEESELQKHNLFIPVLRWRLPDPIK